MSEDINTLIRSVEKDYEKYNETNGGWDKYEYNPVIGGYNGTCFDIHVMKGTFLSTDGTCYCYRGENVYRMYFSWRTLKSIAMVESLDGIHWNEPLVVLGPRLETGWEDHTSRPCVIDKNGKYKMWYCGMNSDHVLIGYAESYNGRIWNRRENPIMVPEKFWEKVGVWCPNVIWDEEQQIYRMWYSAGSIWEPDAIGYATSVDGIEWKKHEANPIFRPEPSNKFEENSVAACQVIKHGEWHLMFYMGLQNKGTARIGVARSKDGITNWERNPANPIISISKGKWDSESCYKPYAIYDKENDRWMLWYNGRSGAHEQIGLAMHPGEDLGF